MKPVKEHFDEHAENYESVLKYPIVSRFMKTRDKEVEKFLGNANGGFLLDVGVGTGYYLSKFSKKFRKIVVLDISEKMLKIFKEKVGKKGNIETRLGSIEDFESREKFDSILCVGVMNYLNGHTSKMVIRKFHRLLKPNSSILITFPDKNNVFGLFYSFFWKSSGIRINTFSKNEVLAMLKEAGFKNIEVKDKNNNMPTFHLIVKAKK